MKKEKGSITLFSLLALLLVTAAIFALLEGTRLQEMRRFAELQTEVALESVFANYNACFWENYRLLGADGLYMEEIFKRGANGRNASGTNLLRLVPEEVQLEEYTRITDGNGSVYVASVASYMKENFVYETAKEVYSQYQAIKQMLDKGQMDTTNITNALEEIKNFGEQKQAKIKGKSSDATGILETAKYWMEVGVLELVVKDIEKVSRTKVNVQEGLLERELQKGKNPMEYTNSWTERILLQQYLLTYLSSFTDIKDNRVLSYELEYLIGKSYKDIDNLKITVTKLLAIREMANYLYLLSDSVRMAQVESMALFLVGATGNTILVETVKIGLLTAWALGESILDVRALLVGKKIPLLKNDRNWTLELEKMNDLSNKDFMANTSTVGFDYENYLGLLLLAENEQTIAMYSMNLQELLIRKQSADPMFCMDSLITQAKARVKYSYKPVFPFLHVIDAEKRWEYSVFAETEYGYY